MLVLFNVCAATDATLLEVCFELLAILNTYSESELLHMLYFIDELTQHVVFIINLTVSLCNDESAFNWINSQLLKRAGFYPVIAIGFTLLAGDNTGLIVCYLFTTHHLNLPVHFLYDVPLLSILYIWIA